jgi:hypothetical protein
MAFGEGLILQDGSAVDGPRTGHLNAIDMMMRDFEMESERNLRGPGSAPEVVHPSYWKDSLTRTIPGPGPMLSIAECWNANVKSKSKIVKELLGDSLYCPPYGSNTIQQPVPDISEIFMVSPLNPAEIVQ